MFRFLATVTTVLILSVLFHFSGCSQDTANMTPLQKAKRDYAVYQKKMTERVRSLEKRGKLEDSDPTEFDKMREKYLEISNELGLRLHTIYFHEYDNKFGESVGVSVSTPPLLIAYLRVRYAYPDKTESELIELYSESIKRGEVKATIDGEHWDWEPENDKPEN